MLCKVFQGVRAKAEEFKWDPNVIENLVGL